MEQIARNLTDGIDGFLNGCRFLIHDRDPLFTAGFIKILRDEGIKSVRLPKRSPNLNAFAERFVRSIKEECLDQMILFSEKSLRYVISEYVEHYHRERNHQGLESRIIRPQFRDGGVGGRRVPQPSGRVAQFLLPGSGVNEPNEPFETRDIETRMPGRNVVWVNERSGNQPSGKKEIHR